MKKSKSIDILPSDNELEARKDHFEELFKKYAEVNDDEEVDLNRLTEEELENGCNDDDDGCGNKQSIEEFVPEAKEDNSTKIVSSNDDSEEKDRVGQQMQLAVQERKKVWKKKGISFTFSKVEDWLRTSHERTHEERMNGDSRYLRTHESKNFESKKSSTTVGQEIPQSQKSTLTESDDESSVDTAKYIRANQCKRVTKVRRTTIIKEYFESTKSHNPQVERKQPSALRATKATLAIDDGRQKQKRRKTRGELNRRYRSSFNTSNNASDSDDSDFRPRETPKKERKMRAIEYKQTPVKNTAKVKPLMKVTPIRCEVNTDTTFNDSARSIKDLPKKIVLRKPTANNTGDKVKITNQLFQDVLGEEFAKDILRKTVVDQEIDASSSVVLELPSSTTSDSEPDILEYFNKRPRLSYVPRQTQNDL